MLATAAMIAATESCCSRTNILDGRKVPLASKSSSRNNSRISASSGVLLPAVSPAMQQSVSGLATSLGKHEQIIARLRQQVNESLAAHQQRLTHELQHIIQATAAQAAAGASAGAAASAAAAVQWGQAAAAAVFRGDSVAAAGNVASDAVSGAAAAAAESAAGQCGNCYGVGDQQSSADTDLLVQLQAATARVQMLQQQLEAAEAKLTMHRAAAVAAKQRIASLEELMAHQQQLQNDQLLRALMGRAEHKNEQPSAPPPPPPQQQQQAHQQHQQNGILLGMPRTLESHSNSSEAGHSCCSSPAHIAAATQDANSEQHAAVPAGDGLANDVAVGPPLVEQQQQQPQQHAHTESPGWELIPSPDHLPGNLQQTLMLRELERQTGSYQQQLRMAIIDNTVLCYECMHLQHLLVRERYVGRSACQAVALQLAKEVVALRGQLEDAHVELDLQNFMRKVGELVAVESSNKQCRQQQCKDGEESEEVGDADIGCSQAAERAQQCQASVQQKLDANRADTEAVLQHLDSRMSAISRWYEDSSWADEVQQQLAAIEQVFAGAGQVQQLLQDNTEELPQQQQLPLQGTSEELSPQHTSSETNADPAAYRSTSKLAKPYVTTPSGHVSLLASRRGTQVLEPFDAALFLRASAVHSGSRRESRMRTRSGNGAAAGTASVEVPCHQHDASTAGPEGTVEAPAWSAAAGCAAGAGVIGACRRTVSSTATDGTVSQLQQLEQQQQQPARRTTSVLQGVAEQLTAGDQVDQCAADDEYLQQSCSLRATGESRYASVADDGGAMRCTVEGRFPAGAAAEATAPQEGFVNSANMGKWPQTAPHIQQCGGAVCSGTNDASDIAVDLVEALHQAAAAVLIGQGVSRYDQQQQCVPAVAVAAPKHSCPYTAGYGQPQQQHAANMEQPEGVTVDCDEETFWDAQEASSALCNDAAQQQQLEQQYSDCDLQVLKQQMAEQRHRMQQLQKQLQHEQQNHAAACEPSMPPRGNCVDCSFSAYNLGVAPGQSVQLQTVIPSWTAPAAAGSCSATAAGACYFAQPGGASCAVACKAAAVPGSNGPVVEMQTLAFISSAPEATNGVFQVLNG